MWQNGIELGCILAALFSGIRACRYMSTGMRLVFAQVAVWSFFYVLMYVVIELQKAGGVPPDNRRFMNIHMILETVLLTGAAVALMPVRWFKTLAVVAVSVFFGVWSVQAFIDGFHTYLNYADVAECLVLSLLYGLLLYEFSGKPAGTWRASPQIVLCLGLLLYFAGSVPYMAMMRYLQQHNPVLNHYLFDHISNVLAGIRYLLTATAFWLTARTKPALSRAR